MVCLSGTLTGNGRSGPGSHDLYTTTLLSYSTMKTNLESIGAIDVVDYMEYEI
jgi:hypothetical protein